MDTHRELSRRNLTREVHVYWTRLPRCLNDAERSACLASLSESERLRHGRFLVKSAADEYLVAHVLVRTVLSRSARVAPHTWRFRNGKHGRPEIDGTPDVHGLRFNLSHTRGLVGCAVRWGSDIGIDLEAIEGGRPVPVHIADRSFAPPETSALRAAPPTERARLFYAFWTLKEAYLKARGLGLAVPLDWVTFALHPGLPIVVHFHPGLGDVADAWEFRLIDPTPCHLLALAVHRGTPQTRISIEEVDLLGLVTG